MVFLFRLQIKRQFNFPFPSSRRRFYRSMKRASCPWSTTALASAVLLNLSQSCAFQRNPLLVAQTAGHFPILSSVYPCCHELSLAELTPNEPRRLVRKDTLQLLPRAPSPLHATCTKHSSNQPNSTRTSNPESTTFEVISERRFGTALLDPP